jgi:hypothetical protein
MSERAGGGGRGAGGRSVGANVGARAQWMRSPLAGTPALTGDFVLARGGDGCVACAAGRHSLRCCAVHPADRTRRHGARIVASAGALQPGWLPRATAGLAPVGLQPGWLRSGFSRAGYGRASAGLATVGLAPVGLRVRIRRSGWRHGPWARARTHLRLAGPVRPESVAGARTLPPRGRQVSAARCGRLTGVGCAAGGRVPRACAARVCRARVSRACAGGRVPRACAARVCRARVPRACAGGRVPRAGVCGRACAAGGRVRAGVSRFASA